jgi:hypothetical protein
MVNKYLFDLQCNNQSCKGSVENIQSILLEYFLFIGAEHTLKSEQFTTATKHQNLRLRLLFSPSIE